MKPSEPHYFTCPDCGGHYFGRDVVAGPDGKPFALNTVRCHADSSNSDRRCDWHGVWINKEYDNADGTWRSSR